MSKLPTQQELENSILLMLGEEARASKRRLNVSQIANKFVPAIGETQVQLAIKFLESQGLVSGSFDNPRSAGYIITRNGLLLIERRFDRVDDGTNSTYHPKAVPDFPNYGYQELAEQGTYVFPVPPESDTPATQTVPTPVIINNHVNPVFTNSNVTSSSDPETTRIAKSGTRAGWTNVWIALIIGLLTIAVSLWIAGKPPF